MHLDERCDRFLEEAIELVQAAGCSRERAMEMLNKVYDRPEGELYQEIGGVSVTLLALTESVGMELDELEVMEIERIESKPPEVFRKRQAEKAALGLSIDLTKEYEDMR